MFITGIGMSQIAPVLPLYIEHLGVNNIESIERYSGFAFGVTFIVSAIFSPIWGLAADRLGRKPMLLRASFGMAIIIIWMGFAQNVFQFICLRILLGAITGYSTACTIMIATQTDKDHAGWALGTLSTSNIAGSLIGPTIGGYIGEYFGLQDVFFLTGALMFIVFITTASFVKESFIRQNKKVAHVKEIWIDIPNKSFTVVLFVTFFVLMIAMFSIEPILTVFVTQVSSSTNHVALFAGIAFSASGLASIIAAPRLGRLSDKIGPQKVLMIAIIMAGLIIIPQAFINHPWQLIALRFLLGIAVAGISPALNTIVKKITPDQIAGRVFGFTMAAGYLGAFFGAVLGGQVAALFGIRAVFFTTSAILLINSIWIYFQVYKKLNRNVIYSDNKDYLSFSRQTDEPPL
jgi:MFS transporter, DHA1 family, multidrug resistance protein